MRLCFTLFVLLFTQLFLNFAHAAPNAGVNADQRKSQASAAKTDDRRKRKPVKLQKKTRSTKSEHLGNPKLKSDVVKPRKAVANKTPHAAAAPSTGKTAAVKVGKSPISPSTAIVKVHAWRTTRPPAKGRRKPMAAIAAAREPRPRPLRQTLNLCA